MTSHGKNHLQPNYYDVLGVDRAASTDDIKAAYRKLGASIVVVLIVCVCEFVSLCESVCPLYSR